MTGENEEWWGREPDSDGTGDAMVDEPAPWGEGVETRTRRAQPEGNAAARNLPDTGSGNPKPAGAPTGGLSDG